MALRRARPFAFSPAGVSDTLDGSQVFPGAMSSLSNLIPDYTTPNLWAPRPASILLTNFTGFTASVAGPSIFKVVGNMVYGLVPTGRNAGHDEPFAYNLATGLFITITGVTSGNTPITASTIGAWEPPTCDIIGTKIVFTHPGFTLGGGVLFGWIDISTPSAPTWTGGNTTTNALPSRPSVVVNFNGRAWYIVNPATGNPGAYFSDVLAATVMTNATQVLTFGDAQRLTAATGLPLFNQLGGIIQSLIVFKSNNAYQITGDAALSNLSLNTLNVATGTAGQRGITTTPQGLAFNAPDGIRICDFQARVSEPIGLYGQGVNRPFVFALNPTRVALSCNANVLRVSTQNTLVSANPWQEYWYDMTKKMWSGPHSFAPTMAQPWNNTFVIASYLNDGNLWQSDITLSSTSTFVENGTQLQVTWGTAILPDFQSMAELEVTEHTINMILDQGGPVYSLNVVDGRGTLLNTFTIMPPDVGAIWGSFVWGGAAWSSAQTGLVPLQIAWSSPPIARKMQFQLTGNAFSTFRIGDMFIRMRELGYLQQYSGGAVIGANLGGLPPGLPPPPAGYVYLTGPDGAYLVGADGKYLLGAP